MSVAGKIIRIYGNTIIEIESKCSPELDPDENIECGNGLHLSPTASKARKYDPFGKILECEVNIDDIAVFSRDISKVRCRKVRVIK